MDNPQSMIRMWLVGFLVIGGIWFADSKGWMVPIRSSVENFAQPVQSKLWDGRVRIMSSLDFLDDRRIVLEELLFLRAELMTNVDGASEIARLRAENESLRKLLGAPLSSSWQYLPAEVIGGDAKGWWIDVGSVHGVELNMLVLSDQLLIGKITDVSTQRAYVEALDDEETPWEVEIRDENTSENYGSGILQYRNGILKVEQILPNEAISKGDLVLTKGVKGLLAGVPLGAISAVGIPEETSVYQEASVWWPINRDQVQHVAVIYKW